MLRRSTKHSTAYSEFHREPWGQSRLNFTLPMQRSCTRKPLKSKKDASCNRAHQSSFIHNQCNYCISHEVTGNPIGPPFISQTFKKPNWSALRTHPHPISENTHQSGKDKHKTLRGFQGKCYGLWKRFIFFLSYILRFETSVSLPHPQLFGFCVFNLCGFSLWSLGWGQIWPDKFLKSDQQMLSKCFHCTMKKHTIYFSAEKKLTHQHLMRMHPW